MTSTLYSNTSDNDNGNDEEDDQTFLVSAYDVLINTPHKARTSTTDDFMVRDKQTLFNDVLNQVSPARYHDSRFVDQQKEQVQILLSVTNLILIILLRNPVGSRCNWNFDIAWSTRRSGTQCIQGSTWSITGWTTAAVLRIIVNVFVCNDTEIQHVMTKSTTQEPQRSTTLTTTLKGQTYVEQATVIPSTHRPVRQTSIPPWASMIESPRDQMEQILQDSISINSHSFEILQPRNFNGSSGSSQGNLVYVRMLNGQLVRKLSTIASFSECATRRQGTDFSVDYSEISSLQDTQLQPQT
ncbi:hypothetical protein OIO90_006381 [Microbotryomycetes sp. JL221]|nr:hypothetical protein OIO90_006381 [Microbotryomycetes sp. JL221]